MNADARFATRRQRYIQWCLGMALLLFPGGISRAAQSNTLRVLTELWPDSLDPSETVSLEGIMIANQVFETLFVYGPDGVFKSRLLDNWKFNEDRTQLNLTLNKETRFSDGSLVTSKDVVDCLSVALKLRINSGLRRIKGAKNSVTPRKGSYGISISGPLSIQITLETPQPRILHALTEVHCAISKRVPSKGILGTGPFVIESVGPDTKQVTLKKNAFFNSKTSPGNLDEIIFSTDPNSAQPFDMSLRESSTLSHRIPYFDVETYCLGFNVDHPNLHNVHERAKLAAFLSKELVDSTLGPVNYDVGGVVPLGLPGYNPERALLDGKGVSLDGLRSRSYTVFTYHPRILPVAQKYCDSLKANGIQCSLVQGTTNELFKSRDNGSLQLFFARLKSSNATTEDLLSVFTSHSKLNFFFRADNPISSSLDAKYDQILAASSSTGAIRQNLVREFETIILNSVLVYPYRYGAEKIIWLSENVEMPVLSTLGPVSLNFSKVRRK